jgi:hypothetical protein
MRGWSLAYLLLFIRLNPFNPRRSASYSFSFFFLPSLFRAAPTAARIISRWMGESYDYFWPPRRGGVNVAV